MHLTFLNFINSLSTMISIMKMSVLQYVYLVLKQFSNYLSLIIFWCHNLNGKKPFSIYIQHSKHHCLIKEKCNRSSYAFLFLTITFITTIRLLPSSISLPFSWCKITHMHSPQLSLIQWIIKQRCTDKRRNPHIKP